MKSVLKWSVAAAALLGAFASAPAQADSFGLRFGSHGGIGFSYDSGGYCDRWGCPDGFWDYPIAYCPVFFDGEWYRGPFYYRLRHGDYYYWIHGDWRRDEWDYDRPPGACVDRFGPALDLDFYLGHGFRWRDEWRERWDRDHDHDHDHGRWDRGGDHDGDHGGDHSGDHGSWDHSGDRNGWDRSGDHHRDGAMGGSGTTGTSGGTGGSSSGSMGGTGSGGHHHDGGPGTSGSTGGSGDGGGHHHDGSTGTGALSRPPALVTPPTPPVVTPPTPPAGGSGTTGSGDHHSDSGSRGTDRGTAEFHHHTAEP